MTDLGEACAIVIAIVAIVAIFAFIALAVLSAIGLFVFGVEQAVSNGVLSSNESAVSNLKPIAQNSTSGMVIEIRAKQGQPTKWYQESEGRVCKNLTGNVNISQICIGS